MKHIFSEHNQEADHLASLGADETRKITVEEGGNRERWKAVREFWGGSKKKNKRTVPCGFGIVIKGVDRKTVDHNFARSPWPLGGVLRSVRGSRGRLHIDWYPEPGIQNKKTVY